MGENVKIALIVALGPTLVGLAGVIAALRAGSKVDAVHVSLNSRLTQLLQTTAMASHAEGVMAERATGAARAAETEVARAVVEADRSIAAEAAAEARTPEHEP